MLIVSCTVPCGVLKWKEGSKTDDGFKEVAQNGDGVGGVCIEPVACAWTASWTGDAS